MIAILLAVALSVSAAPLILDIPSATVPGVTINGPGWQVKISSTGDVSWKGINDADTASVKFLEGLKMYAPGFFPKCEKLEPSAVPKREIIISTKPWSRPPLDFTVPCTPSTCTESLWLGDTVYHNTP